MSGLGTGRVDATLAGGGSVDGDRWYGTGTLFAALWAFALISHVWNQGSGPLSADPLVDPLYWLVLVAGVGVLLRPRSGLGLLVLAGAAVVAVIWRMPSIANHWYLVGLVSAGLLVSGVRLRDVRPFTSDRVVAHAAPYVRLTLLLGYGAAAVSKLNRTFVDPEHSCATRFAEDAAGFWGLSLPAGEVCQQVLAWSVAGIEIAIPLLLLMRPTRGLGIVIAAFFHLAMASTPHVRVLDFTAILIALLVLFAPSTFSSRVRKLAGWLHPRTPLLRSIFAPTWVRVSLGLLLVAVVGLRGLVLPVDRWPVLAWMAMLGSWTAIACLGSWALVHRWRRGPANARLPLRPGVWGHWVLVAITLLIAAGPYLGLRTQGSFTMFSNLRTEQGVSNHYFLPSADLFGMQHDYVEIVASTDDRLEAASEHGELVHELELRRRLSRDPSQPITFVRDGEIHDLERAADRDHLVTVGFWEGKLLHFRNIPQEGPPPCRH